MHYLDEQGLVSKSKQVIRWVDQEENDALLREFSRRNVGEVMTILSHCDDLKGE